MENQIKSETWEHIPEWAIFALEYGTNYDDGLNENERRMIDEFIGKHFPNGYIMSVEWDSYREFDRYPAFGEPCKTYKVLFIPTKNN